MTSSRFQFSAASAARVPAEANEILVRPSKVSLELDATSRGAAGYFQISGRRDLVEWLLILSWVRLTDPLASDAIASLQCAAVRAPK